MDTEDTPKDSKRQTENANGSDASFGAQLSSGQNENKKTPHSESSADWQNADCAAREEQSEEEIFEDEYGDFAPPPFGNMPPPPFGAGFPPPPFPPQGGFPPPMGAPWGVCGPFPEEEVEYEYYIEGENNAELDSQYEDVEEVIIDTNGVQEVSQEPKKGVDALKISEVHGEEIKKMMEEGEEKAREIGNVENVTRVAGKTLKYAVNTMIILVLAFICFVFIRFTLNKISLSGNEKLQSQNRITAKDYKWRLLFTQANAVAKSFYDATGSIEGFVNTIDVMLRGNIQFSDSKKSFYCIKKRDGRTFLKLGAGNDAKCYYMNALGKMWYLKDGGVSGRRVELPESENELLRALTVFDDTLNQRAFPLDEGSDSVLDSMIEYEGQINFLDKPHECISTTDLSSRKTMFFVDTANHFINGITIQKNDIFIRIVFDDYRAFEQNLKVPLVRNVYTDGKLYASVVLDMVVKNREMMLPQ